MVSLEESELEVTTKEVLGAPGWFGRALVPLGGGGGGGAFAEDRDAKVPAPSSMASDANAARWAARRVGSVTTILWAPCAALTEEETCSDPGVMPANRIFLLGGCPDSPAVESKESSVVVEATLVISRGDRGDWTAGSAWPTP